MSEEDLSQPHITMTETMLRFYVFLGQYIDRCLDEKHRQSLPEQEFQQHLATTHDEVVQLLETNRVVKGKAEAEFQRVTDMCRDYLKHPSSAEHQRILQEEREILRVKMLALSDLLAVFRSV
jgi:DNA-binding transcriptional regulator/RsmH inhibitor MraZ